MTDQPPPPPEDAGDNGSETYNLTRKTIQYSLQLLEIVSYPCLIVWSGEGWINSQAWEFGGSHFSFSGSDLGEDYRLDETLVERCNM